MDRGKEDAVRIMVTTLVYAALKYVIDSISGRNSGVPVDGILFMKSVFIFGISMCIYFRLYRDVFAPLCIKLRTRKFARALEAFAGHPGKRRGWKLRRIENAKELCEKWKIKVNGNPGGQVVEDETCAVCGGKGKYNVFYLSVDSPLSFVIRRRYSSFTGQRLTRKQLKSYRFNLMLQKGGMHYLEHFCSETCEASFLLWTLYIPSTAKEHLIRWIMLAPRLPGFALRLVLYYLLHPIRLIRERRSVR